MVSEMKQQDVEKFLELCERHNVTVWIDGGWGVDALLGEQTRPHEDLDIALHNSDVQKLRGLLEADGFLRVDRDDTTEYNFVLGDNNGRSVDFHAFELNDDGSNALGVEYVAEHLTGTGRIGNKIVKTIDPRWMVTFHTWYEPDENDYHDVKLLCEKYKIDLPEIYEKFEK